MEKINKDRFIELINNEKSFTKGKIFRILDECIEDNDSDWGCQALSEDD